MEKKLVKATLRLLRQINHPYTSAFSKELKECPTANVALFILQELADVETDKAMSTYNIKYLTQIKEILNGYAKGHIPTKYI